MLAIVAMAAILLAASVAAPAQGQAPDLRNLRIIFDVEWETEIVEVGSNRQPFRLRSPSDIVVEAVQGKLIWFGHGFGCTDPDRGGLSLVYLRGTHAAEVDCPPFRSGTASDWTERSAQASFRTRLDTKGNVLTLNGEMTGTYSSEMLRCGKERWTTDGAFSTTQSLTVRLTGQTCEVISARIVEREDETNEKGVREITTRTFTSGPGFSCKVEQRSNPAKAAGKVTRMSMPC